jgi:hypothetical protein
MPVLVHPTATLCLVVSEPRPHLVARALDESPFIPARSPFTAVPVVSFAVAVIVRMSHASSSSNAQN